MNPSLRAVQHYEALQELTNAGALAPEGRYASISNPLWFQPDGTPMPARKRLHRSITTDLLNTAPPVELGEQQVAILLAGPPGSGKSSARRALFEASDDQITGGLNPSDFVTIDADTIKEQLLNQAQQDGSLQNFLIPPEARHLQNQGETFCNLDFASHVHEESSLIADNARQTAIEQRRNLILDQVCSNPTKTRALIDKLATQGYSIRIIEIHAEKEFSQESVYKRYLRDYENGQARYVPHPVIDSIYNPDDTSKPRQTIQQLLETNPPKIDAYRRFDAQTVGQPPVLTQRGHRIDDHIQINSTTPKPNTQATSKNTSLER